MKKEISINYNENTQLWKMAKMAKEHGYKQVNEAYWCQVFRNDNGDEIICNRENFAEVDPIETLNNWLHGIEEEPTTEEVYNDIVKMLDNRITYTRYNCISLCIGYYGKITEAIYQAINELYKNGLINE